MWANRDISVKYLCKDIGVKYGEFVSHTLWNPSKVIEANGGIPPLTYQMFLVNYILKRLFLVCNLALYFQDDLF